MAARECCPGRASSQALSSPAVRVVTVVALAFGVAVLAGCGGGAGGTASRTTTSAGGGGLAKDPALAALVPARYRAAGTLKVATDPTYAPMEFVAADNRTIVGVDPDLGAAIGKILGVRFEFVRASFDSIIPGLAAGKYALSMSAFSDTAEREQVVDFVTYGQAGTAVMVAKGNPKKLGPTGNSLCGTRVAVEKGTTQSDVDIPARDKRCRAAGRPTIEALVFPDQQAANLALASGRADAVLADGPVAAYAAARSNGKFEVAGRQYAVDQYGVAIPKRSGRLPQAIRGALNKLVASGAYRRILAKWGVASIAIPRSQINAAGG